MAHSIKHGKRYGLGFTLIELLLVMSILALLASIVSPIAINSIQRSKEAVLKEDLFVFRKAIDDYYADHGEYPDQLQHLVDEKYIRHIPVNPLTEDKSSWVMVRSDQSDDNGIMDVRSDFDGIAKDGTSYNTW